MAVKLSTYFPVFGSFHDRELSNPNIATRKEVKNPDLKIALKTADKRNTSAGSKLFGFSENYEASQKTPVQELVDQLHSCSENSLLTEARAIHAFVLKSGFADDNLLILLNHLMHAYSKCLEFRSAKIVFDNLPRRNVFSWSVMIVGSNQQENFQDGLIYFCEMVEHEIIPDAFAFSAILQSCIGTVCVDFGEMVHGQITVRGFDSHVIVSTTLLNMYAKLGRAEEAYRVFNSMAEHNNVSWNAMLSGFTLNGLHLEAFDHFLKMKEQGFVPDMFTFVSVLKAVSIIGDVDKGKQVHECVSESGMLSNIRVGTALIDMYSKCGDLPKARSVFDMNFADCEVNAPWNAMISGYSQSNYSRQALELFVKMCRNGIKSDLHTYCSVCDAIASLKCLNFAKEVHGMALKSGYDLTIPSVQNAIADAYSKCGSLEEVNKIFNRMKHRDIVSWTTLLTAHSQCSEWEEALIIFSRMREEGFTPTHFTLASVLTSCANLCYLEFGRQIHSLLCKFGHETVPFIESALIDVYAKGGSVNEAEKVFEQISNPDIVSLTAMISCYAYHGFVASALWNFQKMEKMGIKPNEVTLLCILVACSHAGLVEEGLRYFWSMEKNYGLVPKMEHYASVVDLLGRVGRLNEAYEFIMEMTIKPDEMVWQSLLAACRVHNNVELGEIAAKKILSLHPEYSSTYVLLSNTYMERGNFKDAVDLRKVMKEQGVGKEPGYSWIFVGGKVHKFFAGDRDHPQRDDIYLKLEELRVKMKALGYVPDLRYALLGED